MAQPKSPIQDLSRSNFVAEDLPIYVKENGRDGVIAEIDMIYVLATTPFHHRDHFHFHLHSSESIPFRFDFGSQQIAGLDLDDCFHRIISGGAGSSPPPDRDSCYIQLCSPPKVLPHHQSPHLHFFSPRLLLRIFLLSVPVPPSDPLPFSILPSPPSLTWSPRPRPG